MKFFSNNLLKRQTASVMLALWLLALASGIVNACVLDAHGSPFHRVAAGALGKAHAPNELHTQPEVAIHHSAETDTSTALCLKVCNDGSLALQKKSVESEMTDPAPVLVVATLWGVATPVLLAILPTDDPPSLLAGPSLQIRHSRWAL